MKRSYRGLFVVWFVMGIAGCASTQPDLPPQSLSTAQGPSVLTESYKMAVGDQIQVNVWKNPELSVSEPIRPDGKIAVPLAGDVMAAGKEPQQLAGDISNKLKRYIKNPQVTVVLTSLEGQAFLSRIRVTGSVGQNRSMSYQQGMTVMDAVLEAGSVDLYADANNTRLHRRTEEGAVSYTIRLRDIMEEGDMSTNIFLIPGDIITVPERLY